MRYFIGDVRDRDRLQRAMQGVDVVVHAAALKQVPACEYNPMEAVKTNIMGTSNVVEAALDAGVKKVMALSTDKAVNPVNLYGATKLAGEKLTVQSNADARGFSDPLFVRPIRKCGRELRFGRAGLPQTTRVRQSHDHRWSHDALLAVAGTGRPVCRFLHRANGRRRSLRAEIPSMKVIDLAKAIAPNAKVDVIGIRPGEKLHEVLISEDEARQYH